MTDSTESQHRNKECAPRCQHTSQPFTDHLKVGNKHPHSLSLPSKRRLLPGRVHAAAGRTGRNCDGQPEGNKIESKWSSASYALPLIIASSFALIYVLEYPGERVAGALAVDWLKRAQQWAGVHRLVRAIFGGDVQSDYSPKWDVACLNIEKGR